VDKLESIKGFNVELTPEEFFNQVEKNGVAVVGQSGNLTPADKKLYALRDVTATVDSIPLIASSIMSKKLASGAKSIVLDVKVGSGAFMKTTEEARRLARLMVDIGKAHGRRVKAVLSDMDMPLGAAVGNATEVAEAVDVLCGRTHGALRTLSLTLAALMAEAACGLTGGEAMMRAEEALDSGAAFRKMCDWVAEQGGDTAMLKDTSLLPQAAHRLAIYADADGYITKTNAEEIGHTAVMIGAGRAVKDDVIDPSAGIIFRKNVGDRIMRGDEIATLLTTDKPAMLAAAAARLSAAITVGVEPPKTGDIILDIID
jgi:pyrimidine-nucleoside phosphorylase